MLHYQGLSRLPQPHGHFYHEISEQGVYEICTEQFVDVELLVDVMRGWLKKNMDTTP